MNLGEIKKTEKKEERNHKEVVLIRLQEHFSDDQPSIYFFEAGVLNQLRTERKTNHYKEFKILHSLHENY